MLSNLNYPFTMSNQANPQKYTNSGKDIVATTISELHSTIGKVTEQMNHLSKENKELHATVASLQQRVEGLSKCGIKVCNLIDELRSAAEEGVGDGIIHALIDATSRPPSAEGPVIDHDVLYQLISWCVTIH